VRSYYDACAETVGRYDGYVANYLGEGLLVYFGYPQAHEDDAERAVRAGREMLLDVGRLEVEAGQRMALRVGIHSGPVVVGDMAGGMRREGLAVGETVNVAARLQAVAEPETLVISAATLRLVQGIFVTRELGPQRLKGIAEPVVAYQVVQPSGVRSRLDANRGRLTAFVGREQELALLLARWEQVQERSGQVVLITGEAGIGKSRLVQQFRERLAGESHTWLECRCSPYTQPSALQPVIELLEQGLGFTPALPAAERVVRLENGAELVGLERQDTVPLLAALLGVPTGADYAPLQMSPDLQRHKTLDALVAWTLALGELQPVVLLIEDLHWCDRSSLELIERLTEQSPTARVMTVLTARLEFQAPWPTRSNVGPLVLNRLTRRQGERMVTALSPERALPAAVLEQIVTRADGVPLYVEELVKMVLESGMLAEHEGGYVLSGPVEQLAIPDTLQASLMARLDRLSAAREVVQVAAVLGREFSYRLLQAVAQLDEPTLRQGLTRLAEAELLFERGAPPEATYTFKHALVQDTAYQTLLRRRRQELHGRTARALEQNFPERAAAEPARVARHWEECGNIDSAVLCHRQAAEQALSRMATGESISHLRKAIALLSTLPEDRGRRERELEIQLRLGSAMILARGLADPDTKTPWERALALCDETTDPDKLVTALRGLGNFYVNSGDPKRGAEMGERVLQITRQTGDDAHSLVGHGLLKTPAFCAGAFAAALDHSERAIAIYDSAQHREVSFVSVEPGVAAFTLAAWSLWLLGYPDRALQHARRAIALARELAHPFSVVYALFYGCVIHHFRRDVSATRAEAEEAIAVCEKHGFPTFLGISRVLRGLTLAATGEEAAAAEEVQAGFAAAAGTGNQLCAPVLMDFLAAAHQATGRYAEALQVVQLAFAVGAQTAQPFWNAELSRHQGELLLAMDRRNAPEAEALFRRARDLARTQEARSLELRATTNLARLLESRGEHCVARALLTDIYSRFTEGFDTPDLEDAKVVLERLADGEPGSDSRHPGRTDQTGSMP
jgi:predicted ATPase